MGLPEPEPTELDLLIQNWKPIKVPLSTMLEQVEPPPEPEGEELPQPEPEGEVLPSREPEGVELPSREPEEVRELPPPQPQPPPVETSPALPCVVPCPGIVDTLPECPDLPTLDLAPRSQHCQAQLFAWSLSQLPLKPQTSRHGSVQQALIVVPPTAPPSSLQAHTVTSPATMSIQQAPIVAPSL
ncbi:UNVERIFIED_CONTAM: hypothetical protein FKN15_002554 [Acipenser sinensis]